MDFSLSTKREDRLERVTAFMNDKLRPIVPEFKKQLENRQVHAGVSMCENDHLSRMLRDQAQSTAGFRNDQPSEGPYG